ncbi:MAG: DM13 domain-containing protein [Actinomycetota bacterium]|nr:DM13 domain-containing protein [Actinomycetota bacterium]
MPTGAVVPSSAVPTPAVAHAAPRWEVVASLSGSGGAQPASFSIVPGAIQWRAGWTCGRGHLQITTDPPPPKGGPLVDASCPGEGKGYSIQTGPIRLGVATPGPWKVVVEQQVDTPLAEPPLPTMAAGRLLARGQFYGVERKGSGSAVLYQLPDGNRALRFEDFEVSLNTDLFVWLSEAPAPKTSAEAVAAPHQVLGELKSTLGPQNYLVPADLANSRIRSVVIWCEPVAIAYAVAPLA